MVTKLCMKSPLFCKKGTIHKISILQEKQEGGSVLRMSNALRGRISPHLSWLFLKMELSSFNIQQSTIS